MLSVCAAISFTISDVFGAKGRIEANFLNCNCCIVDCSYSGNRHNQFGLGIYLNFVIK